MKNLNFIDTHAHIYFKDFTKKLDSIINSSLNNNVNKILMPNINSSSIEKILKVSNLYPGICYPMLGLHPCYVKDNYIDELQIIKSFIDKTKIVAIGEIGIDLYRDINYYKHQIDAFEKQCHWALENNLPVVIHTRNSLKETIKIVEKPIFKNLSGVFHCFDGSYLDAKKIIDLGFLLGIGGIYTFKNSNLRKTLFNINIENLVLETDSPFLSPEPNRGKINEPANIVNIAEMLSKTLSIPLSKIAHITSKNAINLFGL